MAVLGGGPSSEREISLKTAREVFDHLPRAEFEAHFVEVLPDCRFSFDDGPPLGAGAALIELKRLGTEVVFPGLHGRWGEDGVVQGFLEVAGLPCVGSGVAASALAMDKSRTRDVLLANGFPMPRAVEVRDIEAARAALPDFGLPVVLKDPVGGSSLGMFIARTSDEAEAGIRSLLTAPGDRILMEEHVPGLELTCAVIGNASVGGELTAWPPVLIRPTRSDWFDFKTKYDPDAVEEICPAPVPAEILEVVSERSLQAHRLLRCDGLTRTDFIWPEGGEPLFLEINTLPGLTQASICPKAAAAASVSFSELLARLVTMSLDRAALRARSETP